MKALIIDDEVDICYLLSNMLNKINIETEYVNTITIGLKTIRNNKPEIIFLDNRLPDGMGVEFIPQIKKDFPNSKLILISSYDTPDDIKYATLKGADHFISKPFSRDKIYETIKNLLN